MQGTRNQNPRKTIQIPHRIFKFDPRARATPTSQRTHRIPCRQIRRVSRGEEHPSHESAEKTIKAVPELKPKEVLTTTASRIELQEWERGMRGYFRASNFQLPRKSRYHIWRKGWIMQVSGCSPNSQAINHTPSTWSISSVSFMNL